MTAPALARSTKTGRVYEHPLTGSQVPSITSIIGIMDKPALKYWAAKMTAEYTADNLNSLVPLSRKARVDVVKRAPFRSSDTAANVGDIVHDAIDRRIKGLPVDISTMPPTAAKMMQSFTRWEQHYKPRWLASEFTVWSDKWGYAGTADWAAIIDDTLTLGDTKTGKNVYGEVALQLAAIAHADYILYPDGTQKHIPEFKAFKVLHVRPTFAQARPVEMTGFKAFCHARFLKAWKDDEADRMVGHAPKITAKDMVAED